MLIYSEVKEALQLSFDFVGHEHWLNSVERLRLLATVCDEYSLPFSASKLQRGRNFSFEPTQAEDILGPAGPQC
jgi:hypothetical protein